MATAPLHTDIGSRWDEAALARAKELAAQPVTGFWKIHVDAPRPTECRVWFIREDDGYSVIAPDLPGVASQGASFEEASERFREALAGVLSEYRSARAAVPWKQCSDDLPDDTVERWFVVDG